VPSLASDRAGLTQKNKNLDLDLKRSQPNFFYFIVLYFDISSNKYFFIYQKLQKTIRRPF